jgi:hypothetical protein
MKQQNSIIYKGPSLIDGSPIVVIAIVKTRNRKTGDMVQTYILCDNGLDPMENSKLGNDFSICGNCKHRGEALTPAHPDFGRYKMAKGRTCYVALFQGVLITWKHYKKGGYLTAKGHKAIAALGAGRMVRVGTYGDGAAVPSYIWDSLLSEAKGYTAYSHQSDTIDVDPMIYMISADDETQARQAWQRGNRTFRVIQKTDEIIKGSEILCPASKEAGRRATCDSCKLCAGASIKAKSIAIVEH